MSELGQFVYDHSSKGLLIEAAVNIACGEREEGLT